MSNLSLVAPCHFGLEAVLKKEIYDLGYEIEAVSDGRVTFAADEEGLARSNIGLRSAERILIKVGAFKATTFDELFEGIRTLPWEDYIPADGKFWVKKASSVKSKLFSPSDIQSIVKKAIVERLKSRYKVEWFEETGCEYPLRVSIMKDEVTVALDTSGESLHKRGYRQYRSDAPISETLAAALLLLTPWKGDRILVDPFCGCGTFPIEAAMMAANIAPGVNRDFTACTWENLIDKRIWKDAYEEAKDSENTDVETDIQGYDIDGEIVKAARRNADLAGVGKLIHFQQRDVADLHHPKKYGFIITNPPYGERLSERSELPALYKTFGEAAFALSDWSVYVITGYEDAPKYMGRKAAKNRKIYNGMLKTYFYQFPGERPPKRN